MAFARDGAWHNPHTLKTIISDFWINLGPSMHSSFAIAPRRTEWIPEGKVWTVRASASGARKENSIAVILMAAVSEMSVIEVRPRRSAGNSVLKS